MLQKIQKTQGTTHKDKNFTNDPLLHKPKQVTNTRKNIKHNQKWKPFWHSPNSRNEQSYKTQVKTTKKRQSKLLHINPKSPKLYKHTTPSVPTYVKVRSTRVKTLNSDYEFQYKIFKSSKIKFTYFKTRRNVLQVEHT